MRSSREWVWMEKRKVQELSPGEDQSYSIEAAITKNTFATAKAYLKTSLTNLLVQWLFN